MTEASFDDIFAVMSAASHGDASGRAHVPDNAAPNDLAARFGSALNVLLDDLAFREQAAARMAQRLTLLADAAREFSAASPDYQQLLEVVARRLSELGGDLCSIRTLSGDGEWFDTGGAVYHPTPALAAAARALLSTTPQRMGEGMMGRVAASGLPLLIPKISSADFAASSLPAYRSVLAQLAVTGVVAVPLKSRGEVIGVATLLRSDSEHPFTEDDLRLLESVAEHASLAIANSRAHVAERVAQANYRLMFESNPQPKLRASARGLDNDIDVAWRCSKYSGVRGLLVSMLGDLASADEHLSRAKFRATPLVQATATAREPLLVAEAAERSVRPELLPPPIAAAARLDPAGPDR